MAKYPRTIGRHSHNEELEQQQAQVKVWEQEVTIGDDMVIGVVVRKKPRITPP